MTPVMNVFVYGTLRPGYGNYLGSVLGFEHTFQDASVEGFGLYVGGGFPYMVRNHPGVTTHGTLITYTNPDEFPAALRRLDNLEGYRGPGLDNFYDRILVKVQLKSDGSFVEAFTYSPAPDVALHVMKEHTLSETGDWYNDRRPNLR